MSVTSLPPDTALVPSAAARAWLFARRNPTLVVGGAILALMTLAAIAAPLFAGDPVTINPARRLRPPSSEHWLGTDQLGRDVFARVVWGARVSLQVGLLVAIVSVTIGTMIGLIAGYFRTADALITRFMDGIMAIPAILLAIAFVALAGASVWIVIVAIVLPEILCPGR